MRQGLVMCRGDDQSLTVRSALPMAEPIWEVDLAARARADGLGGNPLSNFTSTVEGLGSENDRKVHERGSINGWPGLG
jgi:hypothetical protein